MPAHVLFFALLFTITYSSAQPTFENLTLESSIHETVGADYHAKSVYANVDAHVRIDRLINGVSLLGMDPTADLDYKVALQNQKKIGALGGSSTVCKIDFASANTDISAVVASSTATNLNLHSHSNLKEFFEVDRTGELAAFTSNNPSISITAANKNDGSPILGLAHNEIDMSANAVMSGFTAPVGNLATNGTNATLLPLVLLNFDAVLTSENVTLDWTTTEHTDFSHFVLQRSIDGKNFKDVMILLLEDVSRPLNQFSYKDNIVGVNASVAYYRLQMNGFDGQQQNSPVRLVDLHAANKLQIQTFPNPVTTELRVTIPANWKEKTTVYEIYNNNGTFLSSVQVIKSPQVQPLNVQTLAPGNYIIRVTNGVEVCTSMFIKH